MSNEKGTPTAATENNNEVGYSRPPKEHQFKKGQSGNPHGRPRGRATRKDLQEIALKEFLRPVKVIENGKKQAIPIVRLLIRKDLATSAKSGNSVSNLTLALLRLASMSGTKDAHDKDDAIQSILESRTILNILPGAPIPKKPIF